MEDPELIGHRGGSRRGHIFDESTGGWMDRADADDYFGADVAERMAAEQQVEFRAYLERRRRGDDSEDAVD